MSDAPLSQLPPTELAEHVLDRVEGRADAQVRTTRIDHGLTRFANSRIHQHVGEVTARVDLRLSREGRVASASTSRLTGDGLADLVESTLAQVEVTPVDPDDPGLAPPHDVRRLDHVDPSTRDATPVDRAEVVAGFVEAGRQYEAAGFCETRTTDVAYASSTGHRAADAATHAVCNGIHRRGATAGMAHAESRGLADLDGAALGAVSVGLADRAADPVDLAPGPMPVVLAPEAAATVAVFLGLYGFNARAVEEGRSFVHLGEQQFDPAFRLADDVTDARNVSWGFDAEGTAKARLELVAQGVSAALAHDRRTAAAAGTSSTGHHVPGSEVFGPMPTDLVVGRGTSSPADLVAGIDRGLLVTSFNDCRVLDPRTLVVTGLTRNGTFLIEDGELGPAVGNLRFTQSFVEALGPGRLRGVGDDDRYAMNEFTAGMTIAPSLALATWNFTGGAEG
jgi:predicted Zn-dependent protease